MTITKVKFANEQGLETGWIYIERPDLTDEEIEEVIGNIAHYGSIAKDDYVSFARAILKKAQEK